MIRGRHRGLPVAIDRSILLPSDLEALHGPPVDQIDSLPNVPTVDSSGFSSLKRGMTRTSLAEHGRRTRSATHTARRLSGGQPTRRMRSSTSGTSRSVEPLKELATPASPGTQFAAAPNVPVKRETPTRPTLNGYLSTIYSEAPTPAGTPNNEKAEKDSGGNANASNNQAGVAASMISNDTNGKDAITLADNKT